MTPLPILLRDSCLAALVLVAAGAWWGDAAGVAAGAGAGLVNFVFHLRTVRALAPGAWPLQIASKQAVAGLLLFVPMSLFHPVAVLAGFLAPVLALSVRGVVGLFRPFPSLTVEQG